MNKSLIVVLIQFAFFTVASSQQISIDTDKTEYKINETIIATFKINANVDSLVLPNFKGLRVINKPNITSSITFLNGKTETTKTWVYHLRSNEVGKKLIASPTFFIKGKPLKGTSKTVRISKSRLTREELAIIQFKAFIEEPIKPPGTRRYIVNKDHGYLEVYNGSKWEFYRKLTPEEITSMLNLK